MVIKEWHTSDGKVIKADTEHDSGTWVPFSHANYLGVRTPNDWISKSILIRHGNLPDDWTLTEIFNPVGVTVRDNTVIVGQVCPILPYRIDETEVCRFRDAFVASQAYDVVDKAIREGWDYVDLIPQYNAAGGWAFIESAAALPD